MLIESVVAEAFGTNCYAVAAGADSECVVIDPGIGIGPKLEALLQRHRLRPVAVVMTHGHPDHTYATAEVCRTYDIPAYIHADDADQLVDPLKCLPPDLVAMVSGRLEWNEPQGVITVNDGDELQLAGLRFIVDHAPGHTPGALLLRLLAEDSPVRCFSGDVLFSGSIGRTDMPGGDSATMVTSLETKVLSLNDDTVVLPGHGPATTIGAERRSNPFLRQVASRTATDGHTSAPSRGL